jgi:phosphoribosylformylglycinamidine cyclo-ligase
MSNDAPRGGMTYKDSGVDYDALDPFKRKCQIAGRETSGNIEDFSNGEFSDCLMSRGESVHLIETPDSYLAHVNEGLGTKNIVADAMRLHTGKSYYENVAQDTLAMIANDMITLGARPLSILMHIAVGESAWFDNDKRADDLITGWKEGCNLSKGVWGGGETPTLRGIVKPNASVLAGSAMGIVKPKSRLIKVDIQDGDAIMFAESLGINANGLTLARDVEEKLPDGYLTRLPDGRTYGETLLDPTHIYVPLIEECLNRGVNIHYVVNITGHGWRKLMRAKEPFTYIIKHLPTQRPIFDFIQKHGGVSDREMYGNLNMGAGLAMYVPQSDVGLMLETAAALAAYNPRARYRVFCAGHIEKTDTKRVVIEPKGLDYGADSLGVR